jgi:peptidoglycan/xylan/chitin deacetylase (PgdA/CDA1 family)
MFNVIPLPELVRRRQTGNSLAGCISLTFDDAYIGVLSLADAVLRKHSLPATMFVSSAFSSNRLTFWWDVVHQLLSSSHDSVLEELLNRNGAPQEVARSGDLESIRSWVLTGHGGVLALDAVKSFPASSPHLRAMDEAELRALTTDGRWTLASHTASHPLLTSLTIQEQEAEIISAWRWLNERFSNTLRFVAYPYGAYSDKTLVAARSAGMTAGFTMDSRAPSRRDSELALPRVGLSQDSRRRTVVIRLSRLLRPLLEFRDARAVERTPARA